MADQDAQHNRPDQDPEHEGRIVPEGSGPGGSTAETKPAEGNVPEAPPAEAPVALTPPPPPPEKPSQPAEPDEEDDEEEGMLRMSFLEHLEELRVRIIRALMGLAIAFFLCLFFTNELWNAVRAPAAAALKNLGLPEDLAMITPTEGFTIIWVRIPVLISLFIASPWILYQVWAFISPGLYKKERRLALPFIFSTAGLFILGGLFAYFVAFRFGLTFLLGIGHEMGVRPLVSITEYVDLFVNVILGVALVFELPVLIFFLTLLHIASPRFLLRHSRYAILLIVIAAAIITPTPDAVNLSIFAAPMILLYFAGVFASYLLVLRREGGVFPWSKVLRWALIVVVVLAALLWLATARYGYVLQMKWPFLLRGAGH